MSYTLGFGATLWRLWITVAGELGVIIPDSFVSFEVILPFLFEEKRRTHRYRLLGNAAPSVDIAIPCCGEDPSIVMDIVVAAASQDHPTPLLRILVLDDKKDVNLERLVRDFKSEKQEGPSITYFCLQCPVHGARRLSRTRNIETTIPR